MTSHLHLELNLVSKNGVALFGGEEALLDIEKSEASLAVEGDVFIFPGCGTHHKAAESIEAAVVRRFFDKAAPNALPLVPRYDRQADDLCGGSRLLNLGHSNDFAVDQCDQNVPKLVVALYLTFGLIRHAEQRQQVGPVPLVQLNISHHSYSSWFTIRGHIPE